MKTKPPVFTILVSIKMSNFHEECCVLCVVCSVWLPRCLLTFRIENVKCQMRVAQQTVQIFYC